MAKIRDAVAVTIPNGGSLSGAIQTNGRRIIGIGMSAAWTAADLSFQALISASGNPMVEVYGEVVDSGGNNVAVTAPAAGEYVALADTLPYEGLGKIKVRSGPVGAPVNQAADRTLYVILGD